MDAKNLFKLILDAYPETGGHSVCDLHGPCKKDRQCGLLSPSNLIDFDSVEQKVDRKIGSRPSVDAIAASGKSFCFIELKGWTEYLKHNIPTEEAIRTQSEYNLKGKFTVSEDICITLSGDPDVFKSIPEVFILVTDIDVKEQGVDNLRYNLMALAVTGGDWESICNKSLSSELYKQITTIPKFYVDCRHLQEKLNEIEKMPQNQ